MTDFLNFRRGHQYESQALAYFNKEAKCNAKKCDCFSYTKNSIFGVNPDVLVSFGLLIEIKSRAIGSAGPLEDSRKKPLIISFKRNCKWYVLVQSITLSCHIILSLRVPIIFWLHYTISYGMLLKL